jgi:hypothetical protein
VPSAGLVDPLQRRTDYACYEASRPVNGYVGY